MKCTLAVVADDLIALALNKSLDAFKNMLQRARTVHRKPRTKHKKQQQQESEDENFHRKRVWNGGSRVLGSIFIVRSNDVRAGEHTVQDFGEPQLLRHKVASDCKLLAAYF